METLNQLPVVVDAAFDSYAEQHNATCLQGTRVKLLHDISKWVDNLDAKTVFWLNGMAGTGKSTISRTLARAFSDTGQLGATFFFKKGESGRGDLAKFFTTLSADLISKQPDVSDHILQVLTKTPSIVKKTSQTQFNKLILEPLEAFCSSSPDTRSIVIIVDALDECDKEDQVRLVISLLSHLSTLKPPRVKVFLTSRPELPPRHGFQKIEGTYDDFVLHEMPRSEIAHDISQYFTHKLEEIRRDHNITVPMDRQLPPEWPGYSNIRSLAEMAIPLFIFAATVCRFLADRRWHPNDRLEKVLAYRSRSQGSNLDAIYLPILNQQIVGLTQKEATDVFQEFRVVVGSIVILASPLSTSALGRLLDFPRALIETRLDLLHSVLSVPTSSESPVRLFHLSFRDFLVDPNEKGENQFWIDEKGHHTFLATKCIQTMDCLRQDICNLQAPGTLRAELEDSRVQAHIRPEVQYACLFWVYHVEQADELFTDGDSIFNFLTLHFLHWVEALSLLGKASEGIKMVRRLLQRFQVGRKISGAVYKIIDSLLSSMTKTYAW